MSIGDWISLSILALLVALTVWTELEMRGIVKSRLGRRKW